MSAVFSPCGLYRYKLTREWGDSLKLAFIMLNPSTADARVDDQTIRRCVRIARFAGYEGVVVGNLFAWRATDPVELKRATDPVGPANDDALAEIIAGAPVVICAWGNGGTFLGRDQSVLRMIQDAGKQSSCLQVTKPGNPKHPLYVPANIRPMPLLSG